MVRTRGGHTGSSVRHGSNIEDSTIQEIDGCLNLIYIDSEDSNENIKKPITVLKDVTNKSENGGPITIHDSGSTGAILRRVSRISGKENEVDIKDSKNHTKIYSPLKKRVKFQGMEGHNVKENRHLFVCTTEFSNKGYTIRDFESPTQAKSRIVDIKSPKEELNEVCGNKIKVAEDSPERKIKPLIERGKGVKSGPKLKDDALRNALRVCKKTPTARRSRKAFNHWLLMRFQPRAFTDALSSLSEHQRSWVRKTGFESLLSFHMNEYPHALGYYLVLSFQRHICSLVSGNISLLITEEDVNEVLGLPKGPKLIPMMKSKHVEDKWRSQYKSAIEEWKVTANMVCEAIKATKDVDRTFKLNFLILMSNILIEGPCQSYVRQNFLGFSGDIDNCHEYNWCEYLIRCLKLASLRWIDNPESKFYTGSLAFLVYFYVDRVVKNKRQVRRSKPTFIGWTDSLILDRQILELSTGTMFHGRIAKPLRDKDSDDESSYESYTWNKVDGFDNDDDGGQKSVNKSIENISKVNTNEEVATEDIFDNLKSSLREYQKFQTKFMKDLASAKTLFGDNSCVASLETIFMNLNKKAANFVSKEITHIKQGKAETYSELDEDLCFTPEDWRLIDAYSVPGVMNRTKSDSLLKSMETQSKNLSLELDNVSTGFKTPSVDRSRTLSDPMIPSFDLNIEIDNEMNLSINKTEANVSVQCDNLVVHNGDTKNVLDRPRREHKKGDKRKSPFIERCTNIRSRTFKKEELDFWNWLHSNTKHPNRILFKWKGITCYKLDFQSMKDGEMVFTSIMDVWSCFLNSMEEYRSSASPKRLFCFTETTVGTLNSIDKNTIELKYDIFQQNMDHVFGIYSTTLNEVDLIFFPIHNVNHYYVICFNLKNPSMDILDNKDSDNSISELYGHQIDVMHTHFVKYLGVKKFGRLVEVSRLKPQRLCMNWQTKENGIDCGIFAMIHMETYMGGGSRPWDSKLAVESYTQGQQIRRFRVAGTYRMFSSPLNEWYKIILDEVNDPELAKYLPDR